MSLQNGVGPGLTMQGRRAGAKELPMGSKQDVGAWSTGKVVLNSLEPSWVPSANTPPNPTITLTLNSSRMSEIKRGSLSALSLLEVFPWSMLPPKALLVSMVVSVAARSHAEICVPCCHRRHC